MPDQRDPARYPVRADVPPAGSKKISGSTISVVGEPDDFEAALQGAGAVRLLVTGRGQFRGRLTHIALHRLRLSAAEEHCARIAFVTVPAGMLLILLPMGGSTAPIWGGVRLRSGELLTVSPGQRAHTTTEGPVCFGSIWLPTEDLARYGHALSGVPFAVPPGICRWLPAPSAGTHLRRLHMAAIRHAATRPEALADAQAAHGLEQELLHALVGSLAAASVREETPAERRHRNVLARFEDLVEAGSRQRMTEICAALGVSDGLLRECCRTHLGMSPSGYRRRRAMQQVHRALRSGDREMTTVSEIARRHELRDLGRFASNYRAIYGELPSTTLRRGARQGVTELALGHLR